MIGKECIAFFALLCSVYTANGDEYSRIGCFADKLEKAISGGDVLRYEENIANNCYKRAKRSGYSVFAIEAKRYCLTSKTAHQTYSRYGPSQNCTGGTGGPWAMTAYMIKPTDTTLRIMFDVMQEEVAGLTNQIKELRQKQNNAGSKMAETSSQVKRAGSERMEIARNVIIESKSAAYSRKAISAEIKKAGNESKDIAESVVVASEKVAESLMKIGKISTAIETAGNERKEIAMNVVTELKNAADSRKKISKAMSTVVMQVSTQITKAVNERKQLAKDIASESKKAADSRKKLSEAIFAESVKMGKEMKMHVDFMNKLNMSLQRVNAAVSAWDTGVKAHRVFTCQYARNDELQLSCPDGNQVIDITSATYGRQSTSICRKGAKGVTNCRSATSERKAKSRCDGRKKCTLKAANSMFGNPCAGVTKYLEVKYTCGLPATALTESFHMLPSESFVVMGRKSFPQTFGVGKVYINSAGIITWENVKGKRGGNQWFGWKSTIFAGKNIRFSYWIKFVDRIPSAHLSYGMRVYGTIYTDGYKRCIPNTWCHIEKTVRCPSGGNDHYIFLFLDDIPHKQKIHVKSFKVEFPERVKKTFSPFDNSVKLMNVKRGLPRTYGVGKMYAGKVHDDIFSPSEFFTWENVHGRRGAWQWIGWQDRAFANEVLRISFWIKFVDRLPALTNNFGIKVYGVINNDFVKRCTPNKWCYVEKTILCRNAGDANHVILIFDSIPHKQTIHVGKMKVEIISVKQTFTVLPLKAVIMGAQANFPRSYGVGKMYAGKVSDSKFNPKEIITWQNTRGSAGSYQWMGWKNSMFANNMLKVSFWIKFVGRVPARSGNFGIKVYGVIYNEFVKSCVRDKWCYAEEVVKCRSGGDGHRVILIFDTIPHKQTARISQFSVEIM